MLEETPEWITKVVSDNPGIWTARLCRHINNIPETYHGIAYCGMCADYANGRKRKRGREYGLNLSLPGFERGQYEIHPRCKPHGLKWLMYQMQRLVDQGELIKLREKIPDLRQPRGWDFASRFYRKEE